MADIFISYSRKDSSHALALAERLRAAGADVWMDSSALAAAETWSAEIVNAINSTRLFFILLSPAAVASHNVNKELSLASEKRKTIVPIVIEKCPLSQSMEYALAGLQRVAITNEEALERAFAKLGISGTGFSQKVNRRRTSGIKRSDWLRVGLPILVEGLVMGEYRKRILPDS
ncbi:MAG: toll/interleukin-1 receptor domain-containing protein [Bacteroidota bacterium]|nr:toll/interleukin-1 receptor domain-containing protein [Bacteroidota bacterium]MDP4230569.1 toll/interleukin-1 receptor domain-containing protein [Bacteroidota bacterium]